MNEGLPRGWRIVRLGDISIKPQYGWTTSASKEGNIKLLRTTDISNGVVNWDNVPFCEKSPGDIESYLIKENDILVSRAGSIGISYRVKKSDLNYDTVFASYLIRFKPLIYVPFVDYFLKSHLYWDFIVSSKAGIAIPNVNATKLQNLPMLLPPLNEQHRIAAKLDKIMPRIERVKERLERIPVMIKRFRQSVLTAAVTGKLTEKWREQHPEVESAENIIDSIKKERINSESSKTQLKKIVELYDAIEKNDSSELPDKWKYTFLNKLCESFQYGTSCKSQKKGIIPVLRMGNLQNGHIDWSNLVYTSDEKEIEKYILKPGDVLFNRTNSADLVGKTSIYLGEHPAIYAGYLIKINNYNKLSSNYLNYALNTQYAKGFCKKVKSDGVNQSNINAQKLGRFEIPLPPLKEQEEIVRQVDRLFALADKMEAHYKKAKEKIDKLPQSILAKAFRGELVQQDPNDEPAHLLLEKIKTQKALIEAENKSKHYKKEK